MIMNFKNRGSIFLLGLGIIGIPCMGELNAAICDVRVENTNQDGRGSYQVALKAPLIEETIPDEKKEPARPREQKKTKPTVEKPQDMKKGKAGPLKKFVPSEKIPADQAVDFPADI
jgi:hypothetical protein